MRVKKVLGWIFNRWTMTAVGLIAISLVIWYGGPLLALGEYRPLESSTARWITIALIVGIYLGRIIWRVVKAKATNSKLFDTLLRQAPAKPAVDVPGAEEIATLGSRFEEAMKVLQQARLGGGGDGKSSGFFARLSKRYVYQLPWYMFIGAPGSGKTTALIHSGLKFPLAERFGNEAIQGVGGTRNCDWWFTDQAVLIDTAGRYTTHEANAETDRAAWNGFLGLLKKFRPRRPINGVLLTISVPDLLQQTAAQRETHAGILRQRLEELHQELGIRFPIYVLITKADLLAGFAEFFQKLGAEERAQVWGATFPYSEATEVTKATGASTAAPAASLFLQEFGALEKRLNDRVIDLLQDERNAQMRALIYAFPQQFSSLKSVLNDFVGKVFAPSRFVEKPLLRGVYFTSGTQEGSAIDRVIGSLGRAMRLEAKLLAPQQPSGRSFFLTRLLDAVIFNEEGLAGANLRWERRRTMLQWTGLGLAAAITIVCASAWTISYSRNKSYVATVQGKVPAVAKPVTELKVTGESDVLRLLPLLQSVRDLPASGTEPGLLMGLGLSQRDKLEGAASSAYRRVLQGAFLPTLSQRIESQLRNRSGQSVEFLYETLKAYVMLHDAEHFDSAALQGYIESDWERNLPQSVTAEQRGELREHLTTLFRHGAVASPVPADANLLADARAALARMPLAERVYSRLKRLGIGKDLPEFKLATAAGPSAALVFTRASGKPLTSGVPSMFSYQAYHSGFIKDSIVVTNQLATEEGWVLGLPEAERIKPLDLKSRELLLNEVRRLYLTEYASTWAAFIDDIRLLRGGGLSQTIQQTRVIAAPDSPLRRLLQAVVKEVTLIRVDGIDKDVIRKAEDVISKAKDTVGVLISGPKREEVPTGASLLRPESIVDDRFTPLREYVKGAPGQPAPIDRTLSLVGELYSQLTATELAVKGGNPPPPTDLPIKAKAEAGNLPEPAKSLLGTLALAGQNQALSGMKDNLSKGVRAEVSAFCSKAIAGRYPFVKGSTSNVTQEDFAQIFGSGRLMDSFFQKNLASLVDTSAQPWRFRQVGDASLGGDSGTLLQFQRAQTIRDVFFRGGATANLRLDFKPVAMDVSISQFVLDVDGQIVKYSHGPQVPQAVQWPGPRGSTQVRVQLTPPGGGLGPFEGPWALFRMFDQVKIEQTAQPEKILATFTVDGRTAQFEVTASSVRNPFRLPELEQFQCPGGL
jgi:type VI secretion system protein ImpL